MKKLTSTLLIMFLLISSGLNFVTAETDMNNTILKSTPEEDEVKIKNEAERTGDIVSASEDGHYNISFDDGYNGYCINYGDHEASEGNNFTVQDTTEAINHKNDKSVGNELKTFFVEYHDIAMEDEIKTQHIIWHFTDDFNGWRIDPTLIEEIKTASSQKVIPDHGAVKQINNTTEAIFNFEVLQSNNPGHQNFFAYQITYRDILKIIENETLANNSTNSENTTSKNETTNNTTDSGNTTNINTTSQNETNPSIAKDITETNVVNGKDNTDNEKHSLMKHETGYNYIPAIIILLFGTILIVKYSRD